MKRITVPLIITALLLCTACSDSQTYENSTDSINNNDSLSDNKMVQVDWEHNKVYQWQDYSEADGNPFGEDFERKLELTDFPDTVFIWRNDGIYSYVNEEESLLAAGMPLWNAFFTDLNFDGFPELCTTAMWGNGISDNHIIVYDYHNKKEYALWRRAEFDYSLYLENDELYVLELPYSGNGDIKSNTKGDVGHLAIENDELVMKQ